MATLNYLKSEFDQLLKKAKKLKRGVTIYDFEDLDLARIFYSPPENQLAVRFNMTGGIVAEANAEDFLRVMKGYDTGKKPKQIIEEAVKNMKKYL